MCPATSDFEELRQQIFAHHAEAFLNRIDPDTGLLRVRPWRGSEKSMHSRAAGVDVRSTASAMTAWAMTGHDELAWKSLAYVLDHQDLDTDSLTYGNFKWHSEWPMALDPNALSFIIPHLWYVHRHASSRMPADLHERLQKCLRLAFDAANAHRCTIAYTNIVLLNQAARLCIADALDWPRARAVAGWEWEEWRNFVNRTGFLPEYNSPAYTGVQLEALAVMLACPASPELHAEIRTVIRHLIAESVSNYHAGIGMVTGPQSRGAYRLRGHTLMDTIYHFVLGTPEPTDGCHIWLGVPIGPDDLLSHVRELKLPRTTRTQTHRFRRQNYLAPDFALGSIDGEVHTTAHNTPFHLAFRTPQTSCAWPMVPHMYALADGHFANQREGVLLAGARWLVEPHPDPEAADVWTGRFSGLNVGHAHRLVADPNFTPGFTVHLGPAGEAELADESGATISPSTTSLSGTVMVVSSPSIHAGWRWLGVSKPSLSLARTEKGDLDLLVTGSREGRQVSDHETAVWSAFLLVVVPRSETTAATLAHELSKAPVSVVDQNNGWHIDCTPPDGQPLSVQVAADPVFLYGIDEYTCGANQWLT